MAGIRGGGGAGEEGGVLEGTGAHTVSMMMYIHIPGRYPYARFDLKVVQDIKLAATQVPPAVFERVLRIFPRTPTRSQLGTAAFFVGLAEVEQVHTALSFGSKYGILSRVITVRRWLSLASSHRCVCMQLPFDYL